MTIQGVNGTSYFNQKVNQNTKNTRKLFSEMLEAAKSDSVSLTNPKEVSTSNATTVYEEAVPWADDPYNNEGVPFGKRSEDVLRKLAALREAAKTADYTGMTDAEIYKTIYDRYDKAFGGNYSGALLNGLHAMMQLPGSRISINMYSQMEDEVRNNVSEQGKEKMKTSMGHVELMMEALYGEMTRDEIRNQIESKCPENPTTLEYCSYLRDMGCAGFLSSDDVLRLESGAEAYLSEKTSAAFGWEFIQKYSREDPRMEEYKANLALNERCSIESRVSFFFSSYYIGEDYNDYKTYLDEFLKDRDQFRKEH